MFNNLISGAELASLLRRVRADQAFRSRFFSKLHLARDARVRASWSHTGSAPAGWWDIPAVRERWNTMISGDAAVTLPEYVARRYLSSATALRCLSIGCGVGGKEREWARTGKFRRIDAVDLSPQRISAAREALRDAPEEGLIAYDVADVQRCSWPPDSYDVVLFEHSLHHFSRLERLLRTVAHILKPDGLLVANEFVGPSRFQWTDSQLTGVNGLLGQFPRAYRTYAGTSYAKDREVRPSRVRMWLSDPSEAAESSRILPVLTSTSSILEVKGYGGAILHLLFSGIAHHFVQPDETAGRLLALAFSTEDALMAGGTIGHDFALVVCRTGKRESPDRTRIHAAGTG